MLEPGLHSTDALLERWRQAWPQALACWSRYTRLHDARLCATTVEAAQEGLSGSFAMIRLADQSVVIDLQAIGALGLQEHAVEILAHEIGHHVLAPGTATSHFRMLARVRRALPTLERHAAMVANLYTDLCINDRLQRQAGLRMAEVYRVLAARQDARDEAGKPKEQGAVWTLYMRIYEHLWRLDKGSLGGARGDDALETDAWLGAKLVRVYANDMMTGASRFSALLLPYLVQDPEQQGLEKHVLDTGEAGAGSSPGGLHELAPGEGDEAIHPAEDRLITDAGGEAKGEPVDENEAGSAGGQTREPFEYGEILKAGGVELSDHQIAIRYYRERALPYMIPFPRKRVAQAAEPQMESVETWDIGEPLDEIDWMQSLMLSPTPVPGLTTVRRVYSRDTANESDPLPVDLDLYVDSSGSMPNPQIATSWLALAGAIIVLSALRAGSTVQVTLWSSKQEVLRTNGFVRDADAALHVLTGFFGGGTCFPIHRLRDTYAHHNASGRQRPVHILMISDDGITTMFDQDERGASGWDIAAAALAAGGAGGTMALNLPEDWETGDRTWFGHVARDLKRARDEQGWQIHAVSDMAGLAAFAQAFARRHYGDTGQPATRSHM
ncbi:vWA domain-containing protein [Telluria sp. B2]